MELLIQEWTKKKPCIGSKAEKKPAGDDCDTLRANEGTAHPGQSSEDVQQPNANGVAPATSLAFHLFPPKCNMARPN